MTEKLSALHSRYIIDGLQQELTPAQIMDNVRSPYATGNTTPDGIVGRIVDESPGPALSTAETDPSLIDKYLSSVQRSVRKASPVFAAQYTRASIEKTLINCLWRMGHFGIGDLCLDARWIWNDSAIGNMAGLYYSVLAAGEFLDALGLCIRYYSEGKGSRPDVSFNVDIRPGIEEDSLVERPFGSEKPRLGAASLPSSLIPDPKSWIVYIPFDTSSYRLGGSLLAQVLKDSPAVAPEVNDPDYFLDCYEVVRELVEDGIVLSGTTVGDGGLITAVKSMTGGKVGACIDISDLRKATREDDPVRLLFAEVPGVVVQIRDIDFDYIDAELLLQDVAFYPLGHPAQGGGVRVQESEKSGIQNILEALIRNQGGEGED